MSWNPPLYNQAQALKLHKVDPVTFVDANTWYDITFDTKNDNESTPDFDFFSSDVLSVIKSNTTGIFFVGGCVRPKWGGAANTAVSILTRIVVSTDAGETYVEKRCLQSIVGRALSEAEVGTQQYAGSVMVSPDDLIKLQAQVSSTDMTFTGSTSFDNPVSVSLQIYGGQLEV